MGVAYKHLPQYTYDDYLLWEGRWELIDGVPYAMAPMPVPEHQSTAGNLHAEFRTALKKAGCHCKVYQPLDYKLSDDTIFNPDLLLVCQPITKKYLDFPPGLVVEILSEGTAMKDRHIKYPRYEAEGIPYYLIVDAENRSVEVYKLAEGKYQRQPLDQSQPFEFILKDCRFAVVFDQIWE
jgi:Uma2 family endonuclease